MDYSNSKIYKIVNDIDDLVYVGSTTQSLSKRFSKHKTHFREQPNTRFYQHVKDVGGWDMFRIILIEEYPCDNRDQLRAREFFHQCENDAIINGLNTNAAQFNLEYTENRINNNDAFTEREKKIKIVKHRSYNNLKANYHQSLKSYAEKNKNKYSCELCGFHTHIKPHFETHNRTQKHQKNAAAQQEQEE